MSGKIDRKAARLLKQRKERKPSSNTEIIVKDNGTAVMRLFGHAIAKFDGVNLYIRTAGYHTRTTKMRLTRVLSAFGRGYGIVQRDFQWYLFGERWPRSESRHWNQIAIDQTEHANTESVAA